MLQRFAAFLLQLRYLAWLVIAPAAIALWYYVPPIKFDQTVEGFFAPDDPALLRYERSKQSFGGDQIVFIVYDDPELWTSAGMDRTRSLADALKAIPGVIRVDAFDEMPIPWRMDEAVESLATQSFSLGTIARIARARDTVRTMISKLEDNPELMERFRARVTSHPMFQGFFVDPTGKTTGLVVRLQPPTETDHKALTAALRRVTGEFAQQYSLGRIAVAGPPVLVADGFTALERDNRVLGGVAMLLMGLTMLIAVRNPIWALLPIAAGWATWQITRSIIVWYDLRLTLSSGPILAQTVVLCMPAASHLVTHFYERMRDGESRRSAARHTLAFLTPPIVWCMFTAAAGYLATWATTSVRPAAQFGVTMAVCSFAAGWVTLLLAPGAMTAVLHHRRGPKETDARVLGQERAGVISRFVMHRPALVAVGFAVPALVLIIGVLRLEFESNYINSFKADSLAARDYRFVESRMGGIGLLEIVFNGPEEITVDWVEEIQATSRKLQALDTQVITSVLSLGDVLVTSSGATFSDANLRKILDLKVRMLSVPGYRHILDNFWNQDDRTMRILVRIRDDTPAERKQQLFREMVDVTRAEVSEGTFLTGLSHLMTQVTRSLIRLSFRATALSALMILIFLWIALRSARLAVLALMPTLLAVGSVLGLMGLIGLKIDISTAVVASIAIGLSVDDSIHCLLRWKAEHQRGAGVRDAVATAFSATTPAVILSSSAVSLGFLAMVLSDFVPMANFGWLVSVATLGGSLGNLVFVPAALLLLMRARPVQVEAAADS